MEKNNLIKVALIGFGHLGKWHAQKCKQIDNSELYAIVESFPENMEKAKLAYPECKIVATLEEVIEQIDAALVVTPTSSHFKICQVLLEKNKHIFCEKPFTSTLEEAVILKKTAETKKLVIQIGHSERFHKVWQKKKLYPEFFKGAANINIIRSAPFKGRATDVSVVSDLMIHDLDLILYLFDEKPIKLSSHGYKMRTDHYDYVSANLFYQSNKIVNIINSRNDTSEKRSLTITNQYGTLFFDLMNYEFSIALGKETNPEKFVYNENYPKTDHLLVEQELFYTSILENTPAIVNINDGVRAVKLIDLVHESLETSSLLDIVDL